MGIDIYDYDDLFDETDERLRKAIGGAVEDDREAKIIASMMKLMTIVSQSN